MPRRPTNSRSGCVSVPHACAHAHALGSGISRLLPLPPTLQAVANGLAPVDRCADHELLKTKVFGLEFSNPLGLAAGCDKQAEAAKQAQKEQAAKEAYDKSVAKAKADCGPGYYYTAPLVCDPCPAGTYSSAAGLSALSHTQTQQ